MRCFFDTNSSISTGIDDVATLLQQESLTVFTFVILQCFTLTFLLGAWLLKVLPPKSFVGADPNVVTYSTWYPLKSLLKQAGHELVPVKANLVDLIWTDKPKRPTNPIEPLPIKYTGLLVEKKLANIRNEMKERNTEVLVITALDEIAWLLNLRGSDIEYNPVFFAYVIVQYNSCAIFINKNQYTSEVSDHLKKEAPEENFIIEPYENVFDFLSNLIQNLNGSVWISELANFALVSLIPKQQVHRELSPIALMKAIKNPTEREGMRNAHIKDAIALCCYFAWLEKNIKNTTITEVSGAKKLEEFRSVQADFKGLSFTTISSVGPHGAIIHYSPSAETDVPLTTDSLYLCDSGGHYLDGTTDVTRTIHLGTPTEYERECFTRVLKGQLQLGTAIFPSKIRGNYLDAFARKFLWDAGLDYSHGTSHGVGSYLCVHEGPMQISWRHIPDDPGLLEGMFISNEPGYYENGKFGIRIEDVVEIVKADTPYNYNNRGYLTFDTITLVPKQQKLIKVEWLTDKEIEILNDYHQKCRKILGPLLDQQGQTEAKEWLWRETEPIKR